jgi:twinkle protein
MTELEFAGRYLNPYTAKGNEIIPTLCPLCKGGKNRDKYTFALNTDKHTYNCKRGSCGRSGTFNGLLKEMGIDDTRIIYKKPKTVVKPIISELEKYFLKRKISKETLDKWRVGSDDKGNIIFPYYEHGELVFVKFRTLNKKMWREDGCKPVLWGMDECTPELPLVIVEGEIDALSCTEAGIENIVSVPSGAEDFTFIEICWRWLERFDNVILWPDSDVPGENMKRKLITKLGEFRCLTVESKYKDANEALVKEGKDYVKSVVSEAKEVPINGLLRMSEVKAFDISSYKRIRSGFTGIDKVIGGFICGQVSIWTGVNSSGKSTLLGQVLIEAVEQGHSVCAYSGELPAAMFRYWIELQVAGKDNLKHRHDDFMEAQSAYVPSDISQQIRKWYHNKFFLYDSLGSVQEQDILKVFEFAARRHDAKVFLIDNIMTTVFEGNDKDFYRQQSSFIGKVVDFAHKHEVHVHVVAHPRKTSGRLTKMDVAGSGDITNRADNVFSVHRLSLKEKNEIEEYEGADTLIDIFKNRFRGKQDMTVLLMFDEDSKRFAMAGHLEDFNKSYGWIERGDSNCPF